MTAVLSPQPQAPASSSQTNCTSTQPTSTLEASSDAAASKSSSSPSSQHLHAPANSSQNNASTPKRSPSRPSASNPSNSHRHSRLSILSRASHHTTASSTRPPSSVLPVFPSSLPYALVRDFAYPPFHPMHYGPQPLDSRRVSGASSPFFESSFGDSRRISDPEAVGSWDSRGIWSAGPWGGDGGVVYHNGEQGDRLPSTSFGYGHQGDDSDTETTGIEAGRLAKNHRKSKSMGIGEDVVPSSTRGKTKTKAGGAGARDETPKRNLAHLGTGLDSQGFFTPGATDEDSGGEAQDSDLDDDDDDDDAAEHIDEPAHLHHHHHQHHDALDESFAGPSLALYTFHPENANELALREGQIIQVGYRHGQGWLVAMDLETGEQGLVPEEYVRLLRDIEGWGEEEDLEGGDEDTGLDSLRSQESESEAKSGEGKDGGDREVRLGEVEGALGEPGGGGGGGGALKGEGGGATQLPTRSNEIEKR